MHERQPTDLDTINEHLALTAASHGWVRVPAGSSKGGQFSSAKKGGSSGEGRSSTRTNVTHGPSRMATHTTTHTRDMPTGVHYGGIRKSGPAGPVTGGPTRPMTIAGHAYAHVDRNKQPVHVDAAGKTWTMDRADIRTKSTTVTAWDKNSENKPLPRSAFLATPKSGGPTTQHLSSTGKNLGMISRTQAAAKMYGTGSKQHKAAIKRFGA